MRSRSVSGVRAQTAVNAVARATTATANELLRCLTEIRNLRGLKAGPLHEEFEKIEAGLRTWLLLRQLTMVVIEMYDGRDRLIERWDMPIVYEPYAGQGDERFNTDIDGLRSLFRRLPPIKARSYDVIVCTTPDACDIPGWHDTSLANADHLKKSGELSKLIDTLHINAGLLRFGE